MASTATADRSTEAALARGGRALGALRNLRDYQHWTAEQMRAYVAGVLADVDTEVAR